MIATSLGASNALRSFPPTSPVSSSARGASIRTTRRRRTAKSVTSRSAQRSRRSKAEGGRPPRPLPDYLAPGLRLLFVGINPGLYSAQKGHYYARRGNLFWRALSQSGLIPLPLGPEDDRRLLAFGIGITDIIKRPSRGIDDLSPKEFEAGRRRIRRLILRFRPKVVCFTALRVASVMVGRPVAAGPIAETIGAARLFALPSPSRRNAAYPASEIFKWFARLKEFVEEARTGS